MLVALSMGEPDPNARYRAAARVAAAKFASAGQSR